MGIPLVALMGRQPQINDYAQNIAQAQQIQGMKNQNALAPGQLQIQQQEIQARQQELERTKAINDAYQQAYKIGPDGRSTIDRDALTTALATNHQGSVIPGVVEGFTKMDQAQATLAEAKNKIKQSEMDYIGSVAHTIRSANYDPNASMLALKHAADVNPDYKPQIDQLTQALQQNPAAFRAFVDQAYDASAKQRELATQQEQADARMKAASNSKEGELPLGANAGSLNQGLTRRFQVLNPGKPLPPEYTLSPTSTQKDFDRVDKLLTQTEGAQGTKAQQDIANQTRQQTMALQQQARGDARTDKSYQFAATQLDKEGKPVEDAVARFGRLADTISQKTPQADALVAPELLTVMAGGAGSGLRMNEAEISRIVGGRSNFESLKAALNKWQLDPSKALSITDSQRGQIQSLMNEVHGKLLQKQGVIDESRQALVDAKSPDQHRQIITDTHKKLTQIDQQASKAASYTPPTGAKTATGPNGHKIVVDNGKWVDAQTGAPIQ